MGMGILDCVSVWGYFGYGYVKEGKEGKEGTCIRRRIIELRRTASFVSYGRMNGIELLQTPRFGVYR
jgi:hypothetical protein